MGHDHLPSDSTMLCTPTHTNPAALLEDTNCHGTASIYNMAKPLKYKLQIVTFRIGLLYKQGYMILCICNLMDGKSSVCDNICMNFPLAYGYHKFVAPKSSNFPMMTQWSTCHQLTMMCTHSHKGSIVIKHKFP